MRLGSWPCALAPEGMAREAYRVDQVEERHRHRYEFNNAYRRNFEENGLIASGTSPDGTIVEIVELADRPWFVAVQFHPEFKSKPTCAHPLFREFIAAALRQRGANRANAAAELDTRAVAS
jgi:CTP synthase